MAGPDKQGTGLLYGAALGAGSGAVTGAQMAAGAGPGAWVGAGLGGFFGMLNGIASDILEEDQVGREEDLQCTKQKLWVQEVLSQHYARRLELYPNRDIFPADLFFRADNAKLRKEGEMLAQAVTGMTKNRLPWSRILIASYATANDASSSFAKYLSEKRAQALATQFIHAGVEPRRVLAQGVVIQEPLVVDPHDSPGRYRQAVEIIPLDF